MEYQKVMNKNDDTTNQPSKFRTRNWTETNGASPGTNSKDNQIKFKTSVIRSIFCDCSD